MGKDCRKSIQSNRQLTGWTYGWGKTCDHFYSTRVNEKRKQITNRVISNGQKWEISLQFCTIVDRWWQSQLITVSYICINSYLALNGSTIGGSDRSGIECSLRLSNTDIQSYPKTSFKRFVPFKRKWNLWYARSHLGGIPIWGVRLNEIINL